MKKTVNENMTPDTETAEMAVATPETPEKTDALEMPISSEEVSTVEDAVAYFDVRPSEPVSIIAGNRVLFMGQGLKAVTTVR